MIFDLSCESMATKGRSYASAVTNVVNKNNIVDEIIENDEGLDVVDDFTKNTHLFHLENIDHPAVIPISKKLTVTENYGPWKRSPFITLLAKNKLVMVNDTVPRPDEIFPIRSQ